VPVTFLGSGIGVLRTATPTGEAVDEPAREALEAIAGTAGVHLGTLRAFARSRSDAERDPLTGLLNRRGLEQAVARLEAQRLTYLVVAADLDHFKAVNDTHGHHAGDDLLTAVAARIGELADLYHGIAGRLGGDEFAVLVPATRHDPAHIAATFHHVVCQPIATTSGTTLKVTASIGYTVASTDLSTSLRAADTAMYHAKRSGTGQPTRYRPGMTIPAHHTRQRRNLRDRGVTE
jgi:diguanylate cyclase (GGDEF)-like protein